METINIPRLHILVTEFLTSGLIMTPQEVSSREPVIFGNDWFRICQIASVDNDNLHAVQYYCGVIKSKSHLRIPLLF